MFIFGYVFKRQEIIGKEEERASSGVKRIDSRCEYYNVQNAGAVGYLITERNVCDGGAGVLERKNLGWW